MAEQPKKCSRCQMPLPPSGECPECNSNLVDGDVAASRQP